MIFKHSQALSKIQWIWYIHYIKIYILNNIHKKTSKTSKKFVLSMEFRQSRHNLRKNLVKRENWQKKFTLFHFEIFTLQKLTFWSVLNHCWLTFSSDVFTSEFLFVFILYKSLYFSELDQLQLSSSLKKTSKLLLIKQSLIVTSANKISGKQYYDWFIYAFYNLFKAPKNMFNIKSNIL